MQNYSRKTVVHKGLWTLPLISTVQTMPAYAASPYTVSFSNPIGSMLWRDKSALTLVVTGAGTLPTSLTVAGFPTGTTLDGAEATSTTIPITGAGAYAINVGNNTFNDLLANLTVTFGTETGTWSGMIRQDPGVRFQLLTAGGSSIDQAIDGGIKYTPRSLTVSRGSSYQVSASVRTSTGAYPNLAGAVTLNVDPSADLGLPSTLSSTVSDNARANFTIPLTTPVGTYTVGYKLGDRNAAWTLTVQ